MTGHGIPKEHHLFVGQELLGFGRCESVKASDFRIAVYPDGRRILQGAYTWSEGFKHGVTWRDLPAVVVDSQGNEIMEMRDAAGA